jgi:hypothetical protein
MWLIIDLPIPYDVDPATVELIEVHGTDTPGRRRGRDGRA